VRRRSAAYLQQTQHPFAVGLSDISRCELARAMHMALPFTGKIVGLAVSALIGIASSSDEYPPVITKVSP